jgi:hypothetical protein
MGQNFQHCSQVHSVSSRCWDAAYLSSPDLLCSPSKPASQPPSSPSSTQQSRQPLVKEEKK